MLKRISLILIGALALSLVVAACGPGPENAGEITPTAVVNVTVVVEPVDTVTPEPPVLRVCTPVTNAAAGGMEEEVRPQDVRYLPHELILLGDLADIERLLEELEDRFAIGYSPDNATAVVSLAGYSALVFEDTPDELIIRLVRVPNLDPAALFDYWNVMFELLEAGQLLNPVFMELNTLTGPAPEPCQDPDANTPGTTGDPNSVGGQPFGDPSLVTADAGMFLGQWSLGETGVNLYETGATGVRRLVTQTGADTRIALFDTSPFATEGLKLIELNTPAAEEGGSPATNLQLCVSHPRLTQESESLPDDSAAQHGLFGSVLAYAVAPGSQIDLIRVLDDSGSGDLMDLLIALMEYGDRLREEGAPPGTTIINLSLGLHDPQVLDADQLEALRQLMSVYGIDGMVDSAIWEEILAPSSPTEPSKPYRSAALFAVLGALADETGLGVTVVAAAGNDSCDSDKTQPGEAMQEPASYTFVTGVMASTMRGERSCFSNAGDLAAPGGNALDVSGAPPVCDAELLTRLCGGMSGPTIECDEMALISLLRVPDAEPDQYQYGYWYGTSFSTPLVSGLSALATEGGRVAPELMTTGCPAASGAMGGIPIARARNLLVTSPTPVCPTW